MQSLTARFRITIDLKDTHARMLTTIMEERGWTQSEAIRQAIELMYQTSVKKEESDETPSSKPGSPGRSGGV